MYKQAQRYIGFDILKAICMFMVVCIHIPFPGRAGEGIVAVSRMAVPVFFMITGFFYSRIVENNGERRQFKKVFMLFLMGNALFFVWNTFLAVFDPGGIDAFWTQAFRRKSLFYFAVLNVSPFSGHLWYLGALLYVLVIVKPVKKEAGWNVLYGLMPLLLIVLGMYSLMLFSWEIPYVWFRNFMFVGLPYFLIGTLLSKYQIKLSRLLPGGVLVLCVILFAATTLLEQDFLVIRQLNAQREHYISTIPLAISSFLLAMKASERETGKLGAWAARIGRRDSTWVYILHPILITIGTNGAQFAGIQDAYEFVAPVVTCAGTIILVNLLRAAGNGIAKLHGSFRHGQHST